MLMITSRWFSAGATHLTTQCTVLWPGQPPRGAVHCARVLVSVRSNSSSAAVLEQPVVELTASTPIAEAVTAVCGLLKRPHGKAEAQLVCTPHY